MRRISLALALIGAIAVTGCGRGSSSSSSGQKGANSNTFNINLYQAPVGGAIATADGQINCGASSYSAPALNSAGDLVSTPVYLTGSATCPKSTSYANGTSVVVTATAASGFVFVAWAGDCTPANTAGNKCTLTGPGDKAPIAVFSKPGAAGHGNFLASTVHGPAYEAFMAGTAGALNCANCHGATLKGQGIAPSCEGCHLAALKVKAGEQCGVCHKDSGDRHQALYDQFAHVSTTFKATIGTVSSVLNPDGVTYTTTVNYSLTKNGTAYAADITKFGQKTVYIAPFDRTTGKIGQTFSCSSSNGTGGNYTAKTTTATFAAETSDAYVYAYFAENPVLWPNVKNYKIYPNVASASKVFLATGQTTPWTDSYVSVANVEGCQKCHPTPYMKHGYRAARVDGIPDFLACRACHFDTRVGEDFVFQLTYDNFPLLKDISLPRTAGAFPPAFSEPAYTAAIEDEYAYVPTVMNDTHMAHAGEIKYPQALANCVVCHEGKLDRITADKNFNGLVCKSCHPTTSPSDAAAPSFANVTDGAKLGLALAYHTFNWKNGTIISGGVEKACTACHADNIADDGSVLPDSDPAAHDGKGPTQYGHVVPLFKDIHSGFDKAIYNASGVKYADSMKTTVGTASFDTASNKLTIALSMSNVPSDATVKPTVTASLYGYDTKDFVISGHSSQFSDKTPNLEWSEGAVIRGTSTPANTSRLDVTPLASAGNSNWTVTIDLTTWAAKLADGSVKRIEVGFLPAAALADGTVVAASGLAVTYDLVNKAVLTDTTGKGANAIVSADKCNACHGALGTTFHSPSYGSAGVVGCRLCHFVGTGGSHLEMQSRSIDSYVHAIHSFQAMDIQNVDFSNDVAALEYVDHIEARYPMFTTLNCKSCHLDGTFNAPDQLKSLAGIQSASQTLKNATRTINGIPSVVTGPGSRACGGCHRAELINEDSASGLASFDNHVGATFGYRDAGNTSSIWSAWIAKIFQ